jgi:protein tyrosine/serine phosphatase
MPPPERLVPLVGAHNFRDLGGYPCRDGRVTRWGRLFRSDTLHELTEADVGVLRSMGLATIVDLRTRRELERTGRGPLGSEAVDYRHLSVLPEDLAERYLWYLDAGRPALVEALTLLTRPTSFPLVFHCAAGKDRTGVLAALVLDILGVDPAVIVADYVITEGRMELILDRYRSDPVFAERLATVPPSRFGVEADTMVRFLAGLHDRFGGAGPWAVASGLDPEGPSRLVELLVEPVG